MKIKLKNFLFDNHYLSVEILKQINLISRTLGFPFVLIGAQARDLILTGKYELSSGTTTKDIDLAIMIDCWEDFEALKLELFKHGFKQVKGVEHKFYYKEIYPIDIVPFGKIEKNSQIAWPPDNDPTMNVIGFYEMYNHSEAVTVDDELTLKVASLAGLSMIKLIAWEDRKNSIKRDGEDLALIMKDYADAGNIDRIYDSDDNDIIKECDFDIELAGSQLLGRDIGRIAKDKTRDKLLSIIAGELEDKNDLLIQTMLPTFLKNYDRTKEMLLRLKKGIDQK